MNAAGKSSSPEVTRTLAILVSMSFRRFAESSSSFSFFGGSSVRPVAQIKSISVTRTSTEIIEGALQVLSFLMSSRLVKATTSRRGDRGTVLARSFF